MDILEAIWIEYGKRVLTCEELSDILKRCGYSKRERSAIIREAINQKKLGIVKQLYTPKESKAISSIVRKELRGLDSVETLKYLTRYSNNLISFSPIQTIDKTQTNINGEWLYKNYVYNAATA